MKTNQTLPSGMRGRSATAKSILHFPTGGKNLNHNGLRAMLVMLLVVLGIGEMWASSPGTGKHFISAKTAAPAQGLVYMSNKNEANVADTKFKNTYPGGSSTEASDSNPSYYNNGSNGCTPTNMFFWARPSRGYEFNGSWGKRANSGGDYAAHPSSKGVAVTGEPNSCDTNEELNLGPWDGTADVIQTTAGGGSATWMRPIANFKLADKYMVTYAVPAGGSYSIHYEYLESYDTGETEYDGTAIWKFRTSTEDYSMTPSDEEAKSVESYAADEITLTVPSSATNFIGWFEDGVKKSENKTYVYKAHASVTIEPKFKEIIWGNATGDLSTNVTAKGTYSSKNVYVAIPTLIGSWESSDFTITPMNTSNSFGSIAIGTIALDKTNSRLVIPYTYTATNWGGVEATLTITPAFGATKEFSIACSAEEVVDYEACIEVNEERVETGSLAEIMTIANGNTYTKPVVKLMQNKTITAPLSFTNSFIFDVNGKVLTANCASAFSIDAASIDVQIIDGSFTQVGEIHTSSSSASNVNVVTFTQKAKLTMQGGTLSVNNTGSGSAYGVNVCNGSIFYMTNGQLTVSANTGDAHGVHVASANDYATFNGGSLNVSAPTNAYGLWSAGQSNITNATINAQTTATGSYGIYVNGGVSTLEGNTITATAATNDAYGAYVNAGRLNNNGGSFTVNAQSNVYGVHVANDATAMLQQKAVVAATATGASGTNVFGINNLGTASLNNITVTATSPTNNAKAINSATGAVSTTIEDGSYTANAETGSAYGLHHQSGMLNVDGGTFKGIIKTSGTNAYGICAASNATIANATMLGEARGNGNTAYGFKGDAVSKDITLANCNITGLSNKSKAYAIYTKANIAANNCTLTATTSGMDNVNDGAEAYGVYAESGTNAFTNCNASVTSNTIKAYGINHVAGSLTVTDGSYIVEAKQMTASGDESSNLYGLYNATGVTSTVNGATFQVTATNDAKSQYAYGACINGTLNSTNATYNVVARRYVYGLYGLGSSNLTLANNTIRVDATNTTTTNSNSSWSYGIYAKKNFEINGDKVDAIGHIKDVYAMFFESTSLGNVLDGKFSAQGNGTNGFGALNAAATIGNVYLKGGVYTSSINLKKYAFTDYEVYNMDGSHPDYADGYRYTIATENPSPYVCRIVNGAYYSTLEAAIQYTLDNSGNNYTIVMTQSYTLPTGDYTLPSNATLIIPRKFDQTTITELQPSNPALPDRTHFVGLLENFLCLTLANDVNLNVDGKIGVSGEMYCVEYGRTSYNNSAYGRIHMEEGSHIQLNSGAYLYAWGFITGSGTITAKSNAEVHEMFQVGDMKTASNIGNHYYRNGEKFFPMNQYCIQNIEVPTTYYYNSRLIGAMRCYYSALGGMWYGEDNIRLIDTSDALFEVTSDSETSWVRKSYDAEHDYQVWDVNSAIQLGHITITLELPTPLGTKQFNSANYIFPVTSNMKIHIMDGDFVITQDAELLPGSSIEIDKTASLTVVEDKNLYVFDKDQWPLTTASCTPNYSLSWPNGTKPSRSVDDAAINVHGNINVEGALYTTNKGSETSKTDGANIYSTNADAGTIALVSAAPSTTSSIDLITEINTNGKVKKTITMDPALLKNGTGASQAYTPTNGTAASHSFAYMNNMWTQTYTNGCFEVVGDKVYAKPSGYVQLKKTHETAYGKEGVEEENHTYLTIDGKLLILMPGCQWWEVEATSDPNVFECKKEGYEGFYYYDDSDSDPDEWTWKLKTVNVTFYSEEEGEGDVVLHTIVTDFNGRPDQSVIPSNPTKETTTGFTYQFYGWKSSVTGDTYKWTDPLEVATTDMSYRPVFTKTKRNYTITLNNANNGASVPLEVPYGDTPEYTAKKDPTAQYTYSFDHWEPAFDAVTGPASYTAVWSSIVNRYTITWVDGGSVLETDKHQLYGSTTAFNGELPSKEMDNNFVYTFSGWRSSLTGNTYADGSTPTVGGETTYEAQFSTTPRYMITFANYNGTQLQKEAVTAGEHPIYNGLTPGRTRDFDGYYRFTGWKNSDGDFYAPNATLPAVTGKETYTAQYAYVTELYLITFKNVKGQGEAGGDNIWSGKFGVDATPFYDPNNDDVADKPTKTGNAQYSYPFTGWTPELQPVSGPATYTAQFGEEINSYTISFVNVDGYGAQKTVDVEYGQTPVCPVTPTKENGVNSYAFTGWDKSIVTVVGEETYTATFSSTPTVRQFDITFDLDNGSPVTIVPVTYGTTPEWTGETPTKPATAQYTYTFAGWYPEFAPVTGEETYTAQYTQTLNSYTIRFVNYDGTELQSSELAYGVLPTYSGSAPKKPADLVNMKAYNFSGWSPAIATATGAATYTAQYNEVDLVASVTTASNETSYYGSWSSALSAANSSANCTLRLYQNVTAPVLTEINQNMTIDLNGCTLSCTTSSTSNNRFIWINQVALIIDDSKGGGKIYFEGTGNKNYNAVRVDGVGSLTVRGGTIQAHATNNNSSSAAYAVLLYNNSTTQGSTLNIYGGELIASHTQNARTASTVYFNGTNYVNVYGGKLKGKNSIFNNNNTANRIVLRGGYYSMDPGTTLTIPSGYEKWDVGASEPEKAEGYVKKVVQVYTITFQNYDGSNLETPKKWEVGTIPAYTGTPTKEPQSLYTFIGWKNTNDDFFPLDEELPAVAANETYTAQFEVAENFDIDGTVPVEVDVTVETTTIHVDGTLEVENGVTLTTTNLILEASESASGQIIEEGTIVADNVYFDLELNTNARHWHAYGVPWQVDVNANPLIEVETGRTLVVGRDCEIVYYDGAKRASEGAGAHCWEYLKHYSGDGSVDVMMPGKGYMIAFTSEVGTVRFTKAKDAPIIYSGKVNLAANNDGATEDDKGWNAMANPMAYHATMNDGPTVGYVHDGGEIGSDGYTKYSLSGGKFIVGKMVYVQSDGGEVTPEYAGSTIDPIVAAAPARRKTATNKKYLALSDYYRVGIENTAGVQGGDVCVLPEEDKAETYVIGHDLSQFGMNAAKPQLWVNRYGTQLALNTTAPVDGVAEFPMSVYAPAAGEYTIALAAQPDDENAVYLTKDGEVIWNLSNGACTLTLTKGTAADYGLRLGEKKAPEVATGFGEAVVDAHGKTTKVLIDGKVFIIREDRVYSIDGQLVK